MSNITMIPINGIERPLISINRNLAGDFIGFTFDNTHSSDFNLIRVSNGSRYESNLLPSFQDATVQGEGKDGLFYFGSTFKERPLKISTAFDELTEENYRKLAETYSDKKLHKLWFDETPYKVYYVKLKQSPIFKNVCFDEGMDKKRIYRGEMDLEFACYPAYAEARASHYNQTLPSEEFVLVFPEDEENKTLLFHNHILGTELKQKRFYKFYGADGATLADSYNFEEWKTASRIKKNDFVETSETKETFETIEIPEGELIPIYNPGDKKADLKIIFTPKGGDGSSEYVFPSTKLFIFPENSDKVDPALFMGIKSFSFGGDDMHIAIDSRVHLISGLTVDGKVGKKVYNKYHITGDFFEVPKLSYEDNFYLKIESGASGTWKLEYKFYYV